MSGRNDLTETLRDSAIVIGVATALLFVWGYSYESFATISGSVPGMFRPSVTADDRAVIGGIVALYFMFPLLLVIWILDQATGWHFFDWLNRTWRLGFTHRAVVVLAALALSVSAVKPIVAFSERSWSRTLRVEEFQLKSGGVSSLSKGMYCVGKRDDTYVFVDTLAGEHRRIFLVHEDQFDSLTLTYASK